MKRLPVVMEEAEQHDPEPNKKRSKRAPSPPVDEEEAIKAEPKLKKAKISKGGPKKKKAKKANGNKIKSKEEEGEGGRQEGEGVGEESQGDVQNEEEFQKALAQSLEDSRKSVPPSAEFRNSDHAGPLEIEELERLYNLCQVKYEDFEATGGVRRTNGKTKIDGVGNVKAQYGRVMDRALRDIVKLTVGDSFLRPDAEGNRKVFVDLGSGVGNAVIAAALLWDCDARGIEFIEDRNAIKDAAKIEIDGLIAGQKLTKVGSTELRAKSFTDQTQIEFMTAADFVWVNNYNEVYGARSELGGVNGRSSGEDGDAQDQHLLRNANAHVASLFAQMKTGTVMVCMDRLDMGNSIEDIREGRGRHQGGFRRFLV